MNYYVVMAIPEVIAHLRSIPGVVGLIDEFGNPCNCGEWEVKSDLELTSSKFPTEMITVKVYPPTSTGVTVYQKTGVSE
jgi:hypothetical protein